MFYLRFMSLFLFCVFSLGIGNAFEDSPVDASYAKQMVKFIKKNDLDRVKFLIESSFVDIEEKICNHSLNTPLLEAASKGKFAIIKYLIESGADINATNTYNSTVLNELINCEYLTQKNTMKIVKYLIQAGADINRPGSDGVTALMCACEGTRPLLITLLIDMGANVKARADNGCTVLMKAVEEDNIEAMGILINRGIHIDAENQFGFNAFTWAIRTGKYRAFNYFINKLNVDINQCDQFGATPLMWAAIYQRVNMVEDLISLGANLNTRITKAILINVSTSLFSSLLPEYETLPVGSTALTFAKRYSISEIVRILEKAGANE